MRLWTVHPKYLDSVGLVALWREALLARKVLQGETLGYTRHSQLIRFRNHQKPLAAIECYLASVYEESVARNFCFDQSKIEKRVNTDRIVETEGQLLYEWGHLKAKLQKRSAGAFKRLANLELPEAHPLFVIVPGGVRNWERIAG